MTLEQLVCFQFCPYYKPSKNEELACRGFLEVQLLLEKGRRISFENRGRAVGPETVKALVRKVCKACPFYREDCDFILKGAAASPCGGFLFLGQLVDDRAISVDDIGEMP
jgi:hypothetical protein